MLCGYNFQILKSLNIKQYYKHKDILENGTIDDRVLLLNIEQSNKISPYLYLTVAEVHEKYKGLDFNDKNIFIIEAPSVLFSLDKKEIVNDLIFDKNDKIMNNDSI